MTRGEETGSLQENGSEVWSEEHEAQKLERLKVLELATLCTLPMALRAAIILDVFEIINKVSPTHHISSSEIAAHIPATTAIKAAINLDRILKLLASREILSSILVEVDHEKYESRYGLTPLCKHLINNDTGMSVAPLIVLLQDQAIMAAYQYLPDAVLEGGESFFKAHGKSLFQLAGEPRFGELFSTAMGSHSSLIMKAVLDSYDGFKKNIRKLVDVGGGFGYCLEMIISRYPHIQGTNFDLPEVVAHAPQYPGVEHVGGDMFEGVPPGEAIFMKCILHDWNDENCVKILKNCYKSLPDNGKVIVVDALLLSAVDGSLCAKVNYSMDVLMLVSSPSGKERTEQEFEDLAVAAGFAGMKVICRADPMSVMEIYKAI